MMTEMCQFGTNATALEAFWHPEQTRQTRLRVRDVALISPQRLENE
jgi:hypothetical protein